MSISKYFIKVPNAVKALYNSENQLLVLIGNSKVKSLKLKVKIHIFTSNHSIFVTNDVIEETSVLSHNKSKAIQSLTITLIKQLITDMVHTVYSKLILTGVGYKAFLVELINNQLNLQLGYSHPIYFRIPERMNIVIIKSTKLILFGDYDYSKLRQISASIRECKTPEPYKGKGISYDNENIILKRGKKV